MRLFEMTCNSCNAQLELDLDKMQAFCPYCGKKLTVDVDKLSDILLEKEKTRQEKQIQDYKLEDKRLTYEYTEQKEKRDYKLFRAVYIWIAVACILIWGWIGIDHYRSQKEIRDKTSHLETIECEIEEAIAQEDYDLALLKAKELTPDKKFSDEDTKMWNEKREAYIEEINQKYK